MRKRRPIVCATTEVKLVWTLTLGRIALAGFAQVPASMWRALAGRSHHDALFLRDTALDMNPYKMIVGSLDVQDAFPHAPHLLPTKVWGGMGLPFLTFMAGCIQTSLYAVITATGLTPWTGTDSRDSQGGAEGEKTPSFNSWLPSRWHLNWHRNTRDTPHTH